MAFLIDNSVLVRWSDPQDPQHQPAVAALRALRAAGEDLFLTSQAVREFWVVATRPQAENGLGLTPDEATEHINQFERLFLVAQDTHAVYAQWKLIVSQYRVSGKPAHDGASP